MGIEIFVADEQQAEPVEGIRWVRLARSVLEAEGVRGEAELSMLFVDEESMADLNQRFHGKEGPTDVLAFPIDDDAIEPGRNPDSGTSRPTSFSGNDEPSDPPLMLGDVVICPAVAKQNAPEHAGSYEDEVALLVVHGILHLLGMDHEVEEEAEAMEAKERALLEQFHKADAS
ncbi:MAG TPA: rRNA maturation RNase YbeY [Acidimicrobiales bacterium]|nr:rRNA maturation RNase YbeY [Acidimicrobiales bacterium]